MRVGLVMQAFEGRDFVLMQAARTRTERAFTDDHFRDCVWIHLLRDLSTNGITANSNDAVVRKSNIDDYDMVVTSCFCHTWPSTGHRDLPKRKDVVVAHRKRCQSRLQSRILSFLVLRGFVPGPFRHSLARIKKSCIYITHKPSRETHSAHSVHPREQTTQASCGIHLIPPEMKFLATLLLAAAAAEAHCATEQATAAL